MMKDIKKTVFGWHVKFFILHVLMFFGAGKIIWNKDLKKTWEALTVLVILLDIYYIIVSPLMFDWVYENAFKKASI